MSHRPYLLPVFAALVAASAALSASAVQSPAPQQWIAGWSTSLEGVGTTTITNRTVRMMARVTIGGNSVRIRLDNTFNTVPVTIAKAYIGYQLTSRSGDSASHGAGVVAGSNRKVLFSGSATTTIPAGGSVQSDAVDLPVIANQDLAISLYIPDANLKPTIHTSAQVRSYMTANSAGDYAADESKSAFTSSTTSTFWLKSIEVMASASGAVVAFGDSITDGTCSTFDGHDRWEDWLETRLAASKAVLNEGIGGNTMTAIRPNGGLARLDRDVLSHQGVTDVIVFMGTNDINKGATAAQVITGLRDAANRIHAAGLRALAATIVPRNDVSPSGTWTAAKTTSRNSVNAWIRTSGEFDAVIDFDSVVRDPASPDLFNRAYNCDNVHPNPLGYFAMGQSVLLAAIQP